jgi:hypothetical protein
MPTGLILFAAMIGLVAWLISRTIRQMQERAALQTQHPTEPWMWRRDWADRSVRDEATIKTGFLWFFAFAWLLMSLPAVLAFREQAERDRILLIFLALFPIVGVGVMIAATYQTLRRRKYGVSTCNLPRIPVALGSAFRGEVNVRLREQPPGGFQARLACIRRIVRSSGKSSSVHEHVLWQDEQTVGSGAVMPAADGVRVPVHFAIPRDGEPTDDSNRRDSILWRLEVRADVPGIDYVARFTLPVFRVEGAPDAEDWPAQAMPAWTPPPYVVFGMSRSGGEEVVVRPSVRFGDWLGYLLFIAVWYIALAFVLRMGAPLWAVVFFGIFGAFVFIAALDILVGRSAISADRQTLTARRSWLGLGKTRTFPAADVEQIVTRTGRSGSPARYNIEARTRDGKSRKIATHLLNRRDAEELAARLWRALGH